ncbi:Similar to S.cerevisiae protein SWD1 (Subunit of the COMPASS (Set1C) complex) [Malassezia sympodialis ATCC 42132]|uniref:Similar to S.cerevisiae protein SWD1 (Subunit of the COMPASS (Set1C) complex) n=1 Tax=Malassezia sympodialis (strain ATCC 42132) TaxID=1230383 RepID=A0A1M8AAA5_MALS4|nr:Similar to S.cerevisiae protein SWD1 (Subunit of the COMPASS (Set1C) complex) [Malassezia sympodialis ATCC 42132]
MNAQLLNPFARDTPEIIEGTLDNAYASCLAFNAGLGLFAGNYLAVGRTDGWVSIYDLETRTILRWFNAHLKSVSSVSWSPLSRYLASASSDWNVNIWDLGNGPARCVRTLRWDGPAILAFFSPITSRSLLVVLESRELYVVTFPEFDETKEPSSTPIRIRLEANEPINTACFTPDGAWIIAGTSKGSLSVFNANTGIQATKLNQVASSAIRQLSFDLHGRNLVANLNDRSVRTFSVVNTESGIPPEFVARHKFQDLIGRTPWSGVAFSSDSEYVMGGAAQSTAHNVYIWDRDAGVLVKILEGPKEPLISAHWHPSRPQIASIASSGDVYLWSTLATEIWSAYAPGFEELERNVEYEEREDEFDLDHLEDTDRQQQDEAQNVNVFENGPVPETSLPKPLEPIQVRLTHSTLAPILSATEPATRNMFVDDDNQVGFFIPPLLEEYVDEKE